jgi:3-phosphoshikimate 1-carboxyvinyltransferase
LDIEILQTLRLKGAVQAPPSKSYTHRAVVMGALANGTSIIREPLIGSDTNASIRAMRALGSDIKLEDDKIIITGVNGVKHLQIPKETINVENSGTTIRFIAALSAHVPGIVKLTGDESIQKRPMGPLLEALTQLGIRCWSDKKDGTPPISIEGGTLKGNTVSIPGNISSQFISALLISSPLAESKITIQLTTPLSSSPYLAITSEMLNKFGIKHRFDPQERIYEIPGHQTYQPINFTIPGDFSSAAFFLAAGAFLDANITISNLDMNNPQGDKQIVHILKDVGANVSVDTVQKTITVRRGSLNPFEVDCGDMPDLVPILAVLASFIPGKSKLFNAAHLRIKESDRLHTITTELRKMDVKIEELPDALIIHGSLKHKGAVVETYNDHRIAMALIIAALPLQEKTLVKNIECIKVSYPTFLEDLKKLGGQFQVIDS